MPRSSPIFLRRIYAANPDAGKSARGWVVRRHFDLDRRRSGGHDQVNSPLKRGHIRSENPGVVRLELHDRHCDAHVEDDERRRVGVVERGGDHLYGRADARRGVLRWTPIVGQWGPCLRCIATRRWPARPLSRVSRPRGDLRVLFHLMFLRSESVSMEI